MRKTTIILILILLLVMFGAVYYFRFDLINKYSEDKLFCIISNDCHLIHHSCSSYSDLEPANKVHFGDKKYYEINYCKDYAEPAIVRMNKPIPTCKSFKCDVDIETAYKNKMSKFRKRFEL